MAHKKQKNQLDPLFVIFEQHLYNFNESSTDRKTFVTNIVVEYLAFLRKQKVAIPRELEAAIIEELGIQVNTILTKKIYGCFNVDDYQRGIPVGLKRQAQSRYRRLQKKLRANLDSDEKAHSEPAAGVATFVRARIRSK